MANKKRIHFTQEEKEKIIKLVEDGKTLQYIADTVYCSSMTIRTFLKEECGITKKKGKNFTKEFQEKVIKMYKEGYGATLVGEKYGINAYYVRKILKENDVKIRSYMVYSTRGFTSGRVNKKFKI